MQGSMKNANPKLVVVFLVLIAVVNATSNSGGTEWKDEDMTPPSISDESVMSRMTRVIFQEFGNKDGLIADVSLLPDDVKFPA